MEPDRRGGGGMVTSVLGMLVIIALVIAGVVSVSPILSFQDVRSTVLMDNVQGVPGSGGEGYSFMGTTSGGVPITWACDDTIEVEINPQGAPEGYEHMVEQAVARLSVASGFTLEVTGETDDRDFQGRGRGPVLLGWADEDEMPELAGPTAGLGGAAYLQGAGSARAVGGMVVLDTDVFDGTLRDDYAQAIVIHELVHVLGLGHTEQRGQLMTADHRGQTDLGEGDLAGLAALREAACD